MYLRINGYVLFCLGRFGGAAVHGLGGEPCPLGAAVRAEERRPVLRVHVRGRLPGHVHVRPVLSARVRETQGTSRREYSLTFGLCSSFTPPSYCATAIAIFFYWVNRNRNRRNACTTHS